MVDRIRALELAGRLATSYPGRTVSEEHAVRWADQLEPLEDAEALLAVTMLTARSTDPPSTAQVRQAIAEAKQETSSEWSTWDCIYVDGIACPNCSRSGWEDQVVHGHLLQPEDVERRVRDLRVEMFGAPA